ncbi:MAG: DUF2782 domain-containing protein [Candidatus Accumulibacter sp.]|jgi:hypothetical protein|nr:DUF2782 domain-containing protein [Accumulibacter sp.]
MRLLILFLTLFIAAAPAWCQPAADAPDLSQPPDLVPLDDSVEPQVTIRQGENETVEEYRVNGRLYKLRVIPQRGEPYILVDHRGDGSFVPSEDPGLPGLSLPQWVIGTF